MRYALMVRIRNEPAYEYTSWPWLWVPQALYGPGWGPESNRLIRWLHRRVTVADEASQYLTRNGLAAAYQAAGATTWIEDRRTGRTWPWPTLDAGWA